MTTETDVPMSIENNSKIYFKNPKLSFISYAVILEGLDVKIYTQWPLY